MRCELGLVERVTMASSFSKGQNRAVYVIVKRGIVNSHVSSKQKPCTKRTGTWRGALWSGGTPCTSVALKTHPQVTSPILLRRKSTCGMVQERRATASMDGEAFDEPT